MQTYCTFSKSICVMQNLAGAPRPHLHLSHPFLLLCHSIYLSHMYACACMAESKITHQHPSHMHQYYPKRITSTLQPLNLPSSIMQGGLCCCTITGTSRPIHQKANHEICKPPRDNQRHKWVHTQNERRPTYPFPGCLQLRQKSHFVWTWSPQHRWGVNCLPARGLQSGSSACESHHPAASHLGVPAIPQ